MISFYLTILVLCVTSALHASERAGPETAVSPDLTGDAGILFWTPEQQITGYSSIADNTHIDIRKYYIVPSVCKCMSSSAVLIITFLK